MRIKRNKGYVLMKRVNKKETMNYGKTKWLLVSFAKAPFEIIDGDRGKNYPKKKDFSQNGYCLFLNTKNVKSNGFNFDNREFITMKKDRTLRAGKLQRGDVVLTTRGTIGNTAYYSNSVSFNYIRINSGMLIFRPNESELCGEYLFHFFQSQYFKKKCDSIISGAAQPQLPIRSLNEAIIPLPKLKIQNRIVEILSTWDQAIEKLDKLISAKQKQFKWLLKKLITDQKNNPERKEVKISRLIQTIQPTKKVQNKNFKSKGVYPVIDQSQSDIAGWTDDEEAVVNINQPVVIFGDHTCSIKYVDQPFAQGADGIKILKTNFNVLPKFLYFFLLENPMKIDGYKRHFSKLKRYMIPLPHIEVQKEIVKILSKWEQEVEMLKQISKKYHKQKKGLMQQLLTGRVGLQ